MISLAFISILFLASAQSSVRMNGFVWNLIPTSDANHYIGGQDWSEECSDTSASNAISLNHSNATEVSDLNSYFTPISVSNTPVSSVQISTLAGLDFYYLLSGSMTWEVHHKINDQVLINFVLLSPGQLIFDSETYPLEMHLHYGFPKSDGTLISGSGVIIRFREGTEENELLSAIIAQQTIDLSSVFPSTRVLEEYYLFQGSEDMRVPVCTGLVAWIVPAYVFSATRDQIDYFAKSGIDSTNTFESQTNIEFFHFLSRSLQS